MEKKEKLRTQYHSLPNIGIMLKYNLERTLCSVLSTFITGLFIKYCKPLTIINYLNKLSKVEKNNY